MEVAVFFKKNPYLNQAFSASEFAAIFSYQAKFFFSRDQEILGSCLIESLAVAGKAASLALGGKIEKTEVNPLSANPTKWSDTLKQFVGNLPTNCLSLFYHFAKLALKGLIAFQNKTGWTVIQACSSKH